MGTTFSKTVTMRGRTMTLHAMVCRSTHSDGWSKTPEAIKACLDKLPVTDGSPIAVLLPGAGAIARAQGADVDAIYDGVAASRQNCNVYTYSRELTRS